MGQPRTCNSANLSIGGGKNFPPKLSEYKDLSQQRLATLIERYGSGANKVAAYIQAAPDVLLSNHNSYSRREIEFIVLNERVVHLDDLILRRTLIGILGELTFALLEELSLIISSVLEWSQQKTVDEIERTVQLFQRVHGVILAR
jgi:glycerol-3-phosphate dehydrogenase